MGTHIAISAFLDLLTEKNVLTDNATLNAYGKGMYTSNQKILAVLKPANISEVQQCVKIANQYKIPLYPVSNGRNWGYGSKVPVTDNNMVIDLSRMNNITDYNEEFGYVTVEPGVSLGQLYKFLREKKSRLLMSTTGGSIGSSLIGNTVERGIATGPNAERAAHVCGFEVVLPEGVTINTGFRRFGNNITSKVFKWGVGPYVDGIFTQSNLGIVTSLTMWLIPMPEYFHIVYYQASDANKYYTLVDKLHDMSATGLVRPTLTMFNNFRVLTTLKQYPWQHEKEIEKLSGKAQVDKVLEYTNEGGHVKLWTGEVCVRGANKEHASIQSQIIKDAISPFADDVVIFEMAKDDMLKILDGETKLSYNTPQDVIKSYLIGKYLGIPTDTPINQSYWRKKEPIPQSMDPDRDNCGMIWICPIVPFNGSHSKKVIDIIESITVKYGFEPAITMQCMSERSIHIIASLAWDREIDGEDEKALTCYTELHHELHKEGYYFYRETTYTMGKVQTEDAYNTFLSALKKSLDPNNILAPGRYIN